MCSINYSESAISSDIRNEKKLWREDCWLASTHQVYVQQSASVFQFCQFAPGTGKQSSIGRHLEKVTFFFIN